MKWYKVSRSNPCPICNKPDWCGVNEDESIRICMRASNENPSRNGGFLYVLHNGEWISPSHKRFLMGGYTLPPPPKETPRIARKWSSRGQRKLTSKEVTEFIENDIISTVTNWDFGVKGICGDDGLNEIGVCCGFGCYQSKSHPNCVGIPMRNAGGDFVGVRFRNVLTKDKTSLYGGSDGLFYSNQLFKHRVETLLICEGATDAIAIAALGFDVVGRSSCATGTSIIRELLTILKPKNLVYIADNDNAKMIAGRYREAGREGAIKLANDIGRAFKMISPLNAKDIREYILNLRLKGTETGQIRVLVDGMIKDARIQYKAL